MRRTCAVLLAAAAIAGCGDDERLPSGDGSVVVVGDSLAVGAEPHLARLLPGRRVGTDAVSGRPLATGLEVVRALDGRPEVLVISLFTNDDPAATGALRRGVREALSRADCVVWATIVAPPMTGTSYAAANAVLRQEARRAGGRLVLAHWDRLVATHPEWLDRDGVHATPEGYRRRARLLARAVERCA